MSIMRSLHTPITLGISTLLLLGFLVQYTEASSQVYPTDGIWEDTFDDRADVTLTNCDVLGGAIVLNTTLSQVSYNFAAQKNHQAYAFQSFFFFPLWKYYTPQRHITRETKFGSNDLYKIKALDQDSINSISYTNTATSGSAINFGDLTAASEMASGFGSSTRAIRAGGWNGGAATNVMDYITIASTGNAVDFGDMSLVRQDLAAVCSSTRGVIGGGNNGVDTDNNVLEYVTHCQHRQCYRFR